MVGICGGPGALKGVEGHLMVSNFKFFCLPARPVMSLMLCIHGLCCWCLWRDDLLLIHDVGVLARHRAIAHVFVIRVLRVGRLAGNGDRSPAQHLQRVHHRACEVFRILLTREVQTVNIFGVAPLVERGGRLIVLQPLQDGAVDDDFVVLQLPSDDAECVVLLVVVDLHLAEARRVARWDPLLEVLVVHHHRGASSDYALLAVSFASQLGN